MAKFSLEGEKLKLASSVIIVATMSNMLVKLGITLFKGSKTAGKLVAYIFGSSIVVGITYIIFSSN
jgi:uncharacterized membrane protein (DUF4010 family)